MSRHFGGQAGRPAYTYIGGGGLPRAIKIIVIVCAGIAALRYLPGGAAFSNSLIGSFGLIPAEVTGSFAIWLLVTYIFLHGGFWHVLFNMFLFWMLGSELERRWGTREFVKYFFICGVGAGISTVLASPSSQIPTIGASGAVYGVLLAYGLLYPNRIIYINFLIPLKVKYYVMFMGGIAFLASLSSPGDGVAHIAHLGGMVFGFVYLRGFGGHRKSTTRSKRGWRDFYDDWRRARLRRKFEVYYNKRRAEKDEDDPNKWTN